MQIVIDIPDRIYKIIQNKTLNIMDAEILEKAVKNGTPLPKEHGDLIDRDDLLYDSYCINDWSGNEVNIVNVMIVKMADTIIEADKTKSEVEE